MVLSKKVDDTSIIVHFSEGVRRISTVGWICPVCGMMLPD
jgi:hypothetical protein